MPLPCSICPHSARKEIDRGLIAGESIRGMAAKHGVSASAIRRHRDSHLRRALKRTVEEARLDLDVDSLVAWAHALQMKTLSILERAEQLDDLTNARGLIQEARRNLELLGRLSGVLEGPNVTIDMRRQVAVLARLDEHELRALARGEIVEGEATEEPLELAEVVA